MSTVARDALGPPFDVRSLLAPMREALIDLMTDRSPSDWDVPTTPGWTVSDTIAHLLGDDLGRISRTRDDHHGIVRGPDEDFPAFIDRTNDEWVTAARRLSPRVLLDLLLHTGKLVRAQWAGHDLDEDSESVSWAGLDPAPLWLDMARDYTEYWIHQAQVREALGEPLLDEPRFVEPVVATFLRALPYMLRDLAPEDGEATLSIEVTDLTPGDWHLRGGADGWRFVTAVGNPDTTVSWTSDTVWRLGSRRIEPAEARARAHVEGDVDVGAVVTSLLSIIREP